MTADTRLRGIVLVALVGLLVALYLLLYHLGFYGELMCSVGSCETVQSSEYARFLGQPVPAWGTAWYAAVLVLSFLALGALSKRHGAYAGVVRLLALTATGGLLFSIYLTAIELFVLHAVCLWCVVSAVLTVLIFALAEPWRSLAGKGLAAPD